MIQLSLVIPAYNEAARIAPTLDALCGWIGDRTDIELIVVDDGSTDRTAAVAGEKLADRPYASVLSLPVNRGKGHAVRVGMLHARGRMRMFLDADGSTPVSEIDHLLDSLAAIGGHGIAFGSIAAGNTAGRRQMWLRSMGGRLGNWLTRILVLPKIRDTQRGCKVMSDCVAKAVFPHCVIDGWGFDVELLALARSLGYPLAEVPVEWSHVDGGHIKPSSYISTLRDLLTIRRRLRSGAYQLDPADAVPAAHTHEDLNQPADDRPVANEITDIGPG